LVVSLATSIGLAEGFDSPLFALAAAVSLVVMYDAAGVRRAAGKQAAILNEIIAALQTHQSIPNEKLKELIGHTPIEVIAGALLGIIVSLIFAYS
ncbi:MAG TPA: divergent PAP2 family protein, partial [Candidatus Atribacteria bacterium]|nr:divergent PAP2 family protein [Candidatus Atribacteria bacterium]